MGIFSLEIPCQYWYVFYMKPDRKDLNEISTLLIKIHKILIDGEFERVEKIRGKIDPLQKLNMLLHDEELAWLRHLSKLMSYVDEVLYQKEPLTEFSMREVHHAVHYLLFDLKEAEFAGKFNAGIAKHPELPAELQKLKKSLEKIDSKTIH